jgi:hypothetical protein
VLILIWLSLGVGIIGRDGDPANLIYSAVIAIGFIGSIYYRFESYGLAITMLTMAIAQFSISIFAIFTKLGLPWSGPLEIILLNSFFIAMFLLSAWMFAKEGKTNKSTSEFK